MCVGASEGGVGRLEEILGERAHVGLPHVEHGARDHPAHAALTNRLRGLRTKVIARIGEARRSRAYQFELAQARRAQRIACIHVRFHDPQPLEEPLGARYRFVRQAAAKLLGIVNVRVEYAGHRELAAGIDDLRVRIARRDLAGLAHRNDRVPADRNRPVADHPAILVDRHHVVGIPDQHFRHLSVPPRYGQHRKSAA